MSTYGIKVSKPGVDVKTAPESALTLGSNLKNIKKTLESSIYTNIIADLAQADITFAHGQGKIPTFRVFFDCSDGKWQEALDLANYFADIPNVFGRPRADATNIYVNLFNESGASRTVRTKIFVFVEKAAV